MNSGENIIIQSIKNEIEARKYMLENAVKFKIPREKIAYMENGLKKYKTILRNV